MTGNQHLGQQIAGRRQQHRQVTRIRAERSHLMPLAWMDAVVQRRWLGRQHVLVVDAGRVANNGDGEDRSQDVLKLRVVLVDLFVLDVRAAASDGTPARVEASGLAEGDDAVIRRLWRTPADADERAEIWQQMKLVTFGGEASSCRLDDLAEPLVAG
jgi:hypothetical protein